MSRRFAGDDAAGRSGEGEGGGSRQEIVAIESQLFNMTATGRGQDLLRLPSQMMEKLSHLADVVSLNDFAPTDQELAVHKMLSQELSGVREEIGRCCVNEAFMKRLRLLTLFAPLVVLLVAPAVRADVIDSASNGFTVKVAIEVQASPATAYASVIDVASWWDPRTNFLGKGVEPVARRESRRLLL